MTPGASIISKRLHDLKQQQHSNRQSMPIEACPTVHPTLEEFSDFYAFTHFLDRTYKSHYGMVKVVPPQGWKGTRGNHDTLLDKLEVSHPIEQNVQGAGGYFEARNLVQPKMTFRGYKKYAEREGKAVEGKSIEERERLFWRTVMYSPPIYGADLTGSLMSTDAGEWDMNQLPSLLAYAMPYRVRGVTEPYCYIGTWKAFFSWHKEDLDLSAINYIHEGEPKVWYAVNVEDSHLLEAAARKHYPSQYLQCHQFLRHKTFLINPETLLKEYPSIRVSKAVHKAGEIVLVFGGAYHEGFNCGFNIAEAVNYATVDWLRQLLSASSCGCSRRSVRTEIESILYNLEESQMFEELLANEEFMQLRAYVQQQQWLQANVKAVQGEKGQPIHKAPSEKKAPTHERSHHSKKIQAKQKPIQKIKKKSTTHPPKEHLHFDRPLLQDEIRKSLNEADQTKKSVGVDHL